MTFCKKDQAPQTNFDTKMWLVFYPQGKNCYATLVQLDNKDTSDSLIKVLYDPPDSHCRHGAQWDIFGRVLKISWHVNTSENSCRSRKEHAKDSEECFAALIPGAGVVSESHTIVTKETISWNQE